MNCPLCQTTEGFVPVKGPDKRVYHQCPHCWLIFVSQEFYPNAEKEKSRYEVHQNTIENDGYVAFLQQAIIPTLPFLKPQSQGLDYGCGPHPTLCSLIKNHGLECDNYDPYFFPDIYKSQYDFIFATECIEHFFYPMRDLQKINSMLSDNGTITILTGMWQSHQQFENWSYARDFTHVIFFHSQTMQFIAKLMQWKILYNDDIRVCIFEKTNS